MASGIQSNSKEQRARRLSRASDLDIKRGLRESVGFECGWRLVAASSTDRVRQVRLCLETR